MKRWQKYSLLSFAGLLVLALPVLLVGLLRPDAERHFGWNPPDAAPVAEGAFGWNGQLRQEGAGDDNRKYFGWNHDPEAVKRVVDKLKFKSFGQTPAFKEADPLPPEVFMWTAHQKLFNGQLPPSKNQGSIGSCVAFGTNNAVCRTLAVAIAFGGAAYEYKDISEEVTYGGARQQICRQGSGGDGTNGSCAAKFVQQYGVCPRDNIGGYDLSFYSVATCRAFGNKGAPKSITDVITNNKVKDITLIKSWAEAKVCLANGWGIAICSNVGFQSKRDQNGIKVAKGSWSHCMCFDGYCKINGIEYGHIENSWGDEEGPTGPGSPSKAGFWAAATTINTMLSAGDSWAFSDVVGFPHRAINWFVFNRQLEDVTQLANFFGVRNEKRFLSLSFGYLRVGS